MRDVIAKVDPRFAPEYAAYYLDGLVDHTRHPSASSLPFTLDGFPHRYTDVQPLAFTLRRGTRERNVYIAAKDGADLDPAALGWADVYGKVNVAPTTDGPADDKVVPIGPSHAVRIWTLQQCLGVAARTHLAGGRLLPPLRHHRRYLALYRERETPSAYEPGVSNDRYVFYNSTLWPNKHHDVNPPRAEFVRACLELGPRIDFEGGFIPPRHDDMPEYRDLLAERRYPLRDYLDRIKRSAVVFNNPAVHACLGWKLGEFLRLGKAIISLPLSRVLPAPLVHGQHIHVVEGGRDDLRSAVLRLVEDHAYRTRLERGARDYYLEHLAPTRVMQRLADAAFRGGRGSEALDTGRQDVEAAD